MLVPSWQDRCRNPGLRPPRARSACAPSPRYSLTRHPAGASLGMLSSMTGVSTWTWINAPPKQWQPWMIVPSPPWRLLLMSPSLPWHWKHMGGWSCMCASTASPFVAHQPTTGGARPHPLDGTISLDVTSFRLPVRTGGLLFTSC